MTIEGMVMLSWFRRAPKLSSYKAGISRDVLIQSSRIIFVDDDAPLLVSHLSRSGFSVDHDRSGSDFEPQVVNQSYDIAILDYSGVGQKYGPNMGLDLLKFIRRVSPRTRIISYTSQALKSGESDFYRLADQVLAKDAGLRESLEYVEEQLQKAFDKEHLFDALIRKLEVASSAEKERIQIELESALAAKDQGAFRSAVKKIAGSAAEKGVDILLNKLFVAS